MNSTFRSTLVKLITLVFIGVLVGNQFDNIWLGLVVSLWIYIAQMLLYYRRFQHWLDAGASAKKPHTDGFWAVVLDQVERQLKKLRKENAELKDGVDFFKDSFQAIDSAVVVLDRNGYIDWCNQATTVLLGINYETDRGRPLANLLRAPEFIRYLEERKFAKPLQVADPKNPAKCLEVQATPFRVNYTLLFVRDVSSLVALERTRQDFVANVSHELRTPLTVITGYLETLRDNATQLPSVWENVLNEMLTQSHRMDHMVTDLIWLSRLESLPPDHDREPVGVEALLASIVADAQVSSEHKKISLSMPESSSASSLAIIGSFVELRSAFTNLVQNAVKYTKAGDEVTVRCFFRGDNFCVSVEDTGEGIDSAHIPRLTERFYRVDDSRTGATGGTGLGLAIVKHVLVRHDARLLITSKIGQGSKFICTFPASRIVGH